LTFSCMGVRMKGWGGVVSSLAACSLFAGQCAASSTTFYFECITNYDSLTAASAPQFTGTLSTYSSNYVQFTISNASGGDTSSITDIYFDDAAHCLSRMSIVNSTGVRFADGAYPTNLPGASGADPDFSTNFSADSDSPTISNGVNTGEYIIFRFKGNYSTVLQNLNASNLRVGIYVQGYADGGTESFVSTATYPIPNAPAPRAIMLVFLGLGLVRRPHSRRICGSSHDVVRGPMSQPQETTSDV
jgi:hypothetical protein